MSINTRALSIAVMVGIAMLGLVQIADPASLGISPVAQRWLGIILAGLGALQGVLPRVQGQDNNPEKLADRIVDMPPAQRQKLRAAVERREPVAPEPIFDGAMGREAKA